MDRIVGEIGKTNNCTFCGVFRRQALDRGARLLAVNCIATGHNADDIAETVIMNILRGDTARLARCTHIKTVSDPDSSRNVGIVIIKYKNWKLIETQSVGWRRWWGDSTSETIKIHLRKGDCDVCSFQETGLFLNGMHICAECLSWPCSCISGNLNSRLFFFLRMRSNPIVYSIFYDLFYRKIWRKCDHRWLWTSFIRVNKLNSSPPWRNQFEAYASDVVSYRRSSHAKHAFYLKGWIVAYRN